MSPPRKQEAGQQITLEFSAKPEAVSQGRYKLGVLAFGSLVNDPGKVLGAMIATRIKTKTPFPVEYGRYSRVTRGGAPTVVRHEAGTPVSAEVLVLRPDVTFKQARNALWNRERRKENSDEEYEEGRLSNSVLVHDLKDYSGVECVLYADFPDSGKIRHPSALELARHAAASVVKAKPGMDGISYLAGNVDAGVVTPMTAQYIHQLQQMFRVADFGLVRLLARSVGLSRSVVDPADIPYDSRLLHAGLSSVALLVLGHRVDKSPVGDWLDYLYGFFELTAGPSVHGKAQEALAELVRRGHPPACDLPRLFHHLSNAELSPGPAWAFMEACIAQIANQET